MKQVIWYIPIHNSLFPDGIPIYGFGMMLFFAFLATTWLGGRLAQRQGIAKEHIQDLAIWLFIGGLLGARITYLLQVTPRLTFEQFVRQLPRIWDGGIILYGSILGAVAGYGLAYVLIFRRYNLSTLRLADIAAPCVAVGICLGRIGCFLNGCCYGQVACPDCVTYPVHFPLSAPAREALVEEGYQTAAGFTLAERQPGSGARVGQVVPGSAAWDSGLRPDDTIVGADRMEVTSAGQLNSYLGSLRAWKRGKTDLTLEVIHAGAKEVTTLPTFTPRTLGLHPTQLYESVSMFLLFLLLMAYYPFRRHDGQVMALLMMCYAVHRALNELLRDDPRPKGFEQYSSWVLFGLGLAFWLWLWSRPAQYKTATPKVASAPAPAPEPARA